MCRIYSTEKSKSVIKFQKIFNQYHLNVSFAASV